MANCRVKEGVECLWSGYANGVFEEVQDKKVSKELWFFFPTPAKAEGGSIKRERRRKECERGKCDPRDLIAYVICHIGDSVICLILTVILLFIFPLVQVVDTVLAKILAETDNNIRELYTLVDGSNDIVLEEVEETFEKNGQFGALCRLYEKANMKEMERKGGNSKLVVGVYEEKLFEVWAKSDVSLC